MVVVLVLFLVIVGLQDKQKEKPSSLNRTSLAPHDKLNT